MLFIALPAQGQGGGTHTTLEQVNQAVRETQRLCEDQIEKGAVPGLAIAVVFQDQVVYAAGFGVRDVNTREPVNADTVFQVASLSKAIGSTVVAELVGEGKISWDSRISDLDPAFAMYDPWVTREITIRDFYSHRSGLPASAGDSLEVLGFNREQILHRLRYQKPGSSFRSHWAYANFGLTAAAVAAVKAYNLTWEERLRAKALQTARHEFYQLALRRFFCAGEQSTGPCTGRWQVGPKIQARSGSAIPGGRSQLIGQRPCQVDAVTAREWAI
jgi:CubicO group peptidase (beta-lactamase class C family)